MIEVVSLVGRGCRGFQRHIVVGASSLMGLHVGTLLAKNIFMQERKYRVESHNWENGSLRAVGGETCTTWGARRPQVFLTRSEAWVQAQRFMAEDQNALVKVYVYSRKVWSNRPCAY